MERVNVVNVLIFNEAMDSILLVLNDNKDDPYWSLPGGYVEQGETLKQAAIREAMEETGLTVTVGDVYMIREVIFKQKKHQALIITFQGMVVGGEVATKTSNDPDEEILDVKWTDLETANTLLAYIPEKIQAIRQGEHLATYHYQKTDEF